MKLFIIWIVILFSSGLLVLNIIGLFLPWESSLIYSENIQLPPGGSRLTYDEANNKLETLTGSTAEIAILANQIIHERIAHYWEDQGIDSYHLRIPIYKNYIMFLLSYIQPNIYLKYEFCNLDLALRRGVGLCSQQTIALVAYLESRDIPARAITLNGHVVATAKVENPDIWWILDPDFGVVIKNDLPTLEKNPDFIMSAYLESGVSLAQAKSLADIYISTPNFVWPEGRMGYSDCTDIKRWTRKSSFYLIWLIPFSTIMLSIIFLLKNQKHAA